MKTFSSMRCAVLLAAILTASLGACGGSSDAPVEVAKRARGFEVAQNAALLAGELAQAGVAVQSTRCFPLQPLPLPGGEAPVTFILLYAFTIAPSDVEKARSLGFEERAGVPGFSAQAVPCAWPIPTQPN